MRAAIIILSVGFFAVLVRAWFHGEQGHQRTGAAELLLLGALLTIAVTGVAHAAIRDSAEAIARHAFQLAPELAETHAALGEVMRERGRYEEALKLYRHALQLEPNHATSIAEIGQTLGSGLGRLAEAIPWAKRAIVVDPAQSWFYYQLGDVYFQLGIHDQAKLAFERGMRVDPRYVFNYDSRIRLALFEGDRAYASSIADRAIVIADGCASIKSQIALAFAAAGHRDGALRIASPMNDSILSRGGASGRLLVYSLRCKASRA